MQKPLSLLAGPELFWAACYLLALLIIRVTGSPVKSMDGFWENTMYIIPLILVPLSFMTYGIAHPAKGWFILRLWIAGLVGGHLLMNKCLTTYSEQGPGIGMGYLVGMILVCIVLIVGTIVAMLRW
jgi:hypothetical protein